MKKKKNSYFNTCELKTNDKSLLLLFGTVANFEALLRMA